MLVGDLVLVSDDDDDDGKVHFPDGVEASDIGCFVLGGQDISVCLLGFVVEGGLAFVDLVFQASDTCLVNAGRAGRLPQTMPQVISAMLSVVEFVRVSIWYEYTVMEFIA